MKSYLRDPSVLWNTVGLNQEETLLIKEEDNTTRMFVVAGKTGAAIWSRLDGAHTPEQIAEEMAFVQNIPSEKALAIVTHFFDDLKNYGLITEEPITVTPQKLVDWPEAGNPPALAQLDLDALVASDMVALASFVGGKSNVGGGGACQVGPGGKNNTAGGQPVCHP